jgi:hypothetical protein
VHDVADDGADRDRDLTHVHPVGDAIGCVGRLECDLVRVASTALRVPSG